MEMSYDFSSKDVSLQAKLDPATVKLTNTAASGTQIGFSVNKSWTFDV